MGQKQSTYLVFESTDGTLFSRDNSDETYRKTFYIPEIIQDPSLYLSPHVFLLGILVCHRAFLSPDINDDPSTISRLKIDLHASELELHLSHDIREQYVFRRCIKTSSGFMISDQPITQGMMGGWVRRIGVILGFERNTICYTLRYMAGNNLDQDSMF